MIPIKLRGTPITEETFKKQGWTKETEEGLSGESYSFWICALPKNSKDPYTPCFISSPTNQKFKALNEGEFIVELNELGGLGLCQTEEEIEVLYEMLTKQSIYK